MKINKNYLDVEDNYFFASLVEKTNLYMKENPDKEIIKLSVGDVTRPLPICVVQAMKKACDEMGKPKTFRGYGFEPGYLFFRQAVCDFYKAKKRVSLSPNEVFINDGAKSDVANILDIFDKDNLVVMCDPVYPVYLETNLMLGRKPIFFHATKENGFKPLPDESTKPDIIYLCNPANPMGVAMTYKELQIWVDFAIKNKAVIIYDSAYEAFIRNDKETPSSIYQIERAKECAIEICSLSKTAGFTGVRCGYTVVPKELKCDEIPINKLWARRQTGKSNGVGYIVQCGATAVFSPDGQKEIKKNIDYYRRNARLICRTLDDLGLFYVGGKDSPYIWVECPNKMTAWQFYDYLLQNAGIVGSPGDGFGEGGKGFFRLTAFNTFQKTLKACDRMKKLLKN